MVSSKHLTPPKLGASQVEERRLWQKGFTRVSGIDEVGRGALAGPVVASAVVLPDLNRIGVSAVELRLIQDSKSLSASQRERAAAVVRAVALSISIGEASPTEIDTLGIVSATELAMCRALDEMVGAPDHLLVDGALGLSWQLRPCTTMVKGDVLCSAVAAASLIAQVHRDAAMHKFDALFPGYGLAAHKGYGAASHRAAIAALGPSPIHRLSFSPMRLPLIHQVL